MIHLPTSAFQVYGNLDIEVFTAEGRPIHHDRVNNKIPATGRNVLRDLLARGVPGSGTGFAPTNMAVGTGTTAPTDGDIKLETEVYRAVLDGRKAFSSRVDYQLFLTVSDANGNTLTEAALVDSPTTDGGNMLARAKFNTAIIKTSSIQAVLTWSIIIASS